MHITKRIDRAFQWAGEKMGGEARTALSDDFKHLEAEMNLRHDGMDRLQRSMNVYVKWLSKRCDSAEDKEKNSPAAFVGRSMSTHGEDFEPASEFGNCLVAMGRANERIAGLQDTYIEDVSATWLDNVERTVAMMKEYQAARKKLENRRLAYDASLTKMQKARRDDYRIEEEVRMNRAKFEESSEDVVRRMQDIKEAEADSVTTLTSFLDAQLDYHERAADELRRTRQQWGAMGTPQAVSPRASRRPTRSRSNTARSWNEPRQSAVYEEPEPETDGYPPRMPLRPAVSRGCPPPPPQPPRPSVNRSSTYEPSRPAMRTSPAPLSRIATDNGAYGTRGDDIFADDASTASGSGSPDWAGRSASPATSYGSLSRSASALGHRKAPPPPPPPVNRAKKPAPPPPSRKPNIAF